jgi:hypothetical protein
MGFHDYLCFTQDFLAKQGWRLLTTPGSLCAKVLKARYYKDSEFMSAGCPKRASHTWRGIIHGRDLLKEGLVWCIGDGSQTKIWEDNWIPRSGAKHPLGCLIKDRPKLVQDLILPSQEGWNESELNRVLVPEDVKDVVCTQIGKPGSSDFRAWNYTKNKQFSIRSAYHLAIQQKNLSIGRSESSRSFEERKGWLALWDAQVPGKMKVHAWRLIENGLAVGFELLRRKIKDGVVCLACSRTETLEHRFWTCPHCMDEWASFVDKHLCDPPFPPKSLRCHADLKGWLLDWIGKALGEEIVWWIMMIYHLWLARNDARQAPISADPRSIVSRVVASVEELKASLNAPCQKTLTLKEHWLPLETNWVKVNTDGAFRLESRKGGAVSSYETTMAPSYTKRVLFPQSH